MSLCKHNQSLLIGLKDKLLIYNIETAARQEIELPEIIIPAGLTNGQIETLRKEDNVITQITHSKCGLYYLVTTHNKQIVVFNQDFTVAKNFVTKRAISKARFSPNNDIVVADKTGDAYLYKNQEAELILGHLSMLLDLQISECGRFIVTCDRDEKIRVSRYPNCYNIESFCLGHGEFVTNVELYKDVLISASGDGTVRFWKFQTGTEIFCLNTNDYITDKKFFEQFSNKMENENVDVNSLPITDMQIFTQSSKIYFAVSIYLLNKIQLYSVQFKDDKVSFHYFDSIEFNGELISFNLSESLFILSSKELLYYCLKDEFYQKIGCNNVNKLYDDYKTILNSVTVNDVQVLYKKTFDNVQEYLDRKKIRLDAKK